MQIRILRDKNWVCSFRQGALVGISPFSPGRTAVGTRARISALPKRSAHPLGLNVKQAPSLTFSK